MNKEEREDLKTVISFIENDMEKEKVINYIREYLL